MHHLLMLELGKLTKIRSADYEINRKGVISEIDHHSGYLKLYVASNNVFIIGTQEEIDQFVSCEVSVKELKHITRKRGEKNDMFFLRVLRWWINLFPREVRDSHESIWGERNEL